ncbi:hypothetical protein BpHYR1_035444 [Brachionus plicatilis]|uniref:Uncharacterized protein n=1 Tax=Brachionus plicatilis TaxID=10195 RepID=A0A3M7SR94_BRAPC|nr:hypothetical protein BpHYR1_035444 [Brachionus plicatilis]
MESELVEILKTSTAFMVVISFIKLVNYRILVIKSSKFLTEYKNHGKNLAKLTLKLSKICSNEIFLVITRQILGVFFAFLTLRAKVFSNFDSNPMYFILRKLESNLVSSNELVSLAKCSCEYKMVNGILVKNFVSFLFGLLGFISANRMNNFYF